MTKRLLTKRLRDKMTTDITTTETKHSRDKMITGTTRLPRQNDYETKQLKTTTRQNDYWEKTNYCAVFNE